jgi:hypothetical protein
MAKLASQSPQRRRRVRDPAVVSYLAPQAAFASATAIPSVTSVKEV